MKYIIDNNTGETPLPTLPEVSVEFDESFLLNKLKKGQLIDKIHKEMKLFKDIDRQIKNNNLFMSIGNNNFISEDAKQKILSILKEEFYKNKSNDRVNVINKLDSIFNDSKQFEQDKIEFKKIENELNNI